MQEESQFHQKYEQKYYRFNNIGPNETYVDENYFEYNVEKGYKNKVDYIVKSGDKNTKLSDKNLQANEGQRWSNFYDEESESSSRYIPSEDNNRKDEEEEHHQVDYIVTDYISVDSQHFKQGSTDEVTKDKDDQSRGSPAKLADDKVNRRE